MRKLIVSSLITLGLAGALSANEDLLASVTTGKVDGTSFELSKEDNLKVDGGGRAIWSPTQVPEFILKFSRPSANSSSTSRSSSRYSRVNISTGSSSSYRSKYSRVSMPSSFYRSSSRRVTYIR